MSNYMRRVGYVEPLRAKDNVDAIITAYGKLMPDDKLFLDRQAKALGRGINGMGQGIALEVLGKLGQWLNRVEATDAIPHE